MLNFAWKVFKRAYSGFVLHNQNDVKEFISKDFLGVEKIKDIVFDNIHIRIDLLGESDNQYLNMSIIEVYSIIHEKAAKNEALSKFEANLYNYVIDKFDRFKLLKTVFLSIYFTIIFSSISIIISILLFFLGIMS